MTILHRARQWIASGLTPTALIGIKLLVLCVVYLVYSEVAERAAVARQSARFARDQVAALSGLRNDEGWIERAAQLSALQREWSAGFWLAPTPGIAAAQVQGALEAEARALDFNTVNVRVAPEPLEKDGQPVLRYDATLRGSNDAVVRILVQLALYQPRLIVTDLNMNFQRGNGNLRISGIAPYAPQTAPTESGQADDAA